MRLSAQDGGEEEGVVEEEEEWPDPGRGCTDVSVAGLRGAGPVGVCHLPHSKEWQTADSMAVGGVRLHWGPRMGPRSPGPWEALPPVADSGMGAEHTGDQGEALPDVLGLDLAGGAFQAPVHRACLAARAVTRSFIAQQSKIPKFKFRSVTAPLDS